MTHPLRIAVTADPELPVPPLLYGGIERVVDMLCRELTLLGHNVTLFANPASKTNACLVPWPGAVSSSRIATVRNALTLATHVMAGEFDVVHSFSRAAYLTPILPLRVPKLMSYQRPISEITVRAAYALSKGSLDFSAISKQMMRSVSKVGKWHLVYNGVPVERFQFRPKVSVGAPLVFLGRLERIKGPHIAIDVAKSANLPLVLAGNVDPQHREWFSSAIAPHIDGERITYIGPVNDAAKSELLGRSLALLMPILWEEPFGIVMAEAMACGTPVIGFGRGSVPEVVRDGVTGYVVSDSDAMVEAARRVSKIARADCRAHVEQNFSERVVTEAYVSVYRAMINKRKQRKLWERFV